MSIRSSLSAVRGRLAKHGVSDMVNAAGGRYVFSALNQLNALALLHGTDKSSHAHGYANYYADHLAHLRFRKVRLVEIGVGGHEDPALGGSSLRMWRDYLPRAEIIGVDLHPKELSRLGGRVRVVRCDQSDAGQLADLADAVGVPDVIIDDGSHVGSHILTFITTLFPSLAPGGWYVIEDLHTTFHPAFHDETDTTPLSVVFDAVRSVQDNDATARRGLIDIPASLLSDVAAVHVYPGIAFIQKTPTT